MNELKFIPLSDIEMISNYRDVEPVSETDPDVIELAQSFLKMGVLQPALLRPKKGVIGKYELIFGHRRYMGCRVAKLEMIPSNIQEVADGDILELQVTENLQRKDVHGMDEAIAFQSLIKDKGYTVEDIAARFGKKLDFITHRLKLNDLIPDLQKAFKKNAISIGQAFVLCRLKTEDQKLVASEFKDNFHTASVWDVQDWINRNVIRQLSSAPFKRNDITLNPKAGACDTCQKRSGCNTLLFADIKEDDRCFDSTCFQVKMDAFFLVQLREIVETKPSIHIVQDTNDKVAKEAVTLLKQMNVTVLPNEKWNRYGYGIKNGVAAKGFFLNGHYRGKIETIYIAGTAKKDAKAKGKGATKRTAADIDLEITGIKCRQKRAAELDLEKIHKETVSQMKGKPAIEKPGLKHQGQVDRGILIYLLVHELARMSDDEIRGALKNKLPKEPTRDKAEYQVGYIKALGQINDDDLAFIIRKICMEKYAGRNLQYGIGTEDATLRLIAEYSGVDIKTIEGAQSAEAKKRIERADKRIKALQAEKKALPAPKSNSAKEKSDKKAKGSKANKGIKRLLDMDDDELTQLGSEDE